MAFAAFSRSSGKLNWSDRAAQVVSDGIVSGRSIAIGNGARSVFDTFTDPADSMWIRVLSIRSVVDTSF